MRTWTKPNKTTIRGIWKSLFELTMSVLKVALHYNRRIKMKLNEIFTDSLNFFSIEFNFTKCRSFYNSKMLKLLSERNTKKPDNAKSIKTRKNKVATGSGLRTYTKYMHYMLRILIRLIDKFKWELPIRSVWLIGFLWVIR